MLNFVLSILISLSNIFAVSDFSDGNKWNIEKNWLYQEGVWEFTATTSTLPKDCTNALSLAFPQVIHGVHKVWVDDRLVLQTGDSSFQNASSFYERPSVDCKYLMGAQSVKWTVVSYSKFFAKFKYLPKLVSAKQVHLNRFFDIYLNVFAAINIAILLLLAVFLFVGKISRNYLALLVTGGLALIGYSIFIVSDHFFITISMINAHKVADACLWIGATSYFYFFKKRKYISKTVFSIYLGFLFLSMIFLLFGNSADLVQFGTMLPMPVTFVVFAQFLFRLSRKLRSSKFNYLELFSGLLFILISINDLLNIFDLIDGYMLVPSATIFVFFHMAAIVNDNIQTKYIENETLMKDLERKHVLEQIAHDIKSPLSVLNMLVPSFIMNPSDEKATLLTQATSRIAKIAEILLDRKGTYSGHSKFFVSKAIKQVLDEKRIETKDTGLIYNDFTDGNTKILMNEVEFFRVVSNLINNSIEATQGRPTPEIKIETRLIDSTVAISIMDNGQGFPYEVLEKIGKRGLSVGKNDFENSGSGLGLFHANAVVKSCGGKLSIESTVGSGAKINILIPRA